MDTTCRRYAGRTALVTGAGSGIGAATALRLAAEGATVTVADLDAAGARATVDAIRAAGGAAEAAVFDACDPAAWDAIASEGAPLDVGVLNVGRNERARLTELTDAAWHAQLRVSLDSVFLGARALLPRLDGGSLVITSSIHALQGFEGFPAYAAAKGAILSLTRQLAVDYAPGVRVNAVVPGAIETPLWGDYGREYRDRVARLAPLGRLGRTEEVAAAVAFLGSADAAFITGQSLVIDGGRTAGAQEWYASEAP